MAGPLCVVWLPYYSITMAYGMLWGKYAGVRPPYNVYSIPRAPSSIGRGWVEEKV